MFVVLLLQRGSHLNDVHRFLCVLLKKHHGGGIRVHVELLQQPSAVFASLVYIAKADKISEGKRCKLECRLTVRPDDLLPALCNQKVFLFFFLNIVQLI